MKRTKNFKIFIIIGIVVTVLIGIIIYFIVQNNKSIQKLEEVKSLSPNLDKRVNELQTSHNTLSKEMKNKHPTISQTNKLSAKKVGSPSGPTVTNTEFGHLAGVTSSIQDQIAKIIGITPAQAAQLIKNTDDIDSLLKDIKNKQDQIVNDSLEIEYTKNLKILLDNLRTDVDAKAAQGATGPRGQAGAQGATGPRGAQGATGPRGLAGAQGGQGATGPRGLQGLAGAQGGQGATGPQGLQGPQGGQGATGPQGLTGPQGGQGATGPTAPTTEIKTLIGNAIQCISDTDVYTWDGSKCVPKPTAAP